MGTALLCAPQVESSPHRVGLLGDENLAVLGGGRPVVTIHRQKDFGDRGSRPSTAGVGHTGYLMFGRNKQM